MAAIKKLYDITLDLKRQSNIELKGLVAGDTGTVFRIDLTDGGAPVQDVDIDACRIIMKIRSSLGWRAQDSIIPDNEVAIENGIITIALHPETFASGKNLVQLSVYSSEVKEWDTLVTTQYFSFDAQASVDEEETIKTSATYPALIDAINRAKEATDNIIGIDKVTVNDNGHLIIHYTNGKTVDAGALNTIGNEGRHIIMTDDGGNLYAGHRLLIGEDAPDADNLQEGDIYLKEVGDWSDMTAVAYSVPHEAEATAAFNSNTGEFTFGIPVGAAGKTPARGTDYWTAEDVQAIHGYVDSVSPKRIQDLNAVIDNVDPASVSVPDGTVYFYVRDL